MMRRSTTGNGPLWFEKRPHTDVKSDDVDTVLAIVTTAKRDPKRSRLIEFAALTIRGHSPWSPSSSNPATASAAVALTIALSRALRDRGVLSSVEMDDILSEASGRFTRGSEATAFLYVIEQIRADLERADAE
jgi:hypothetical protein